MIWAQLVHLSKNQWGADAWYPESPNGWRDSFSARTVFDEGVWCRVTAHLAAVGATMVVVDVGDAVVMPSHPELAVAGAWTPEKMFAEARRLKEMGLEPIPKLNFATTHDQWLKEYGRMVATPKYYEVCRDVIRDTCEIFGRPRLFHIGLDEELMDQIKAMKNAIGTFRRGKAWWHDVRFYAECCERCGARPWMFSDYAGDFPEEFIANCPKSIVQSAWYYRDLFGDEPTKKGIKNYNGFWLKHIRTFDTLHKGGFDQIPCGSSWRKECIEQVNTFKRLVEYCESKFSGGNRIMGYLQTAWRGLRPGTGGEDENILAAEQLKEARDALSS